MELIIVFSIKIPMKQPELVDSKYILLTINVHEVDRWDCSHGGIYSARSYDVRIDFSSNVNPLGISRAVLIELKKELRQISSNYPDPECIDLKKSLIRYLDNAVSIDQINVGNGATELIDNFVRSFGRNEVVVPSPTFCEYELASRRAGAKVKFLPLSNWEIDPDSIIESSRKANIIFLCNPNNPTGILSSKSIRKVLESTSDKTKILLDESFIELTDDPKAHLASIEDVNEYPNLVVLRSLTKSHGLAGLRIGYSVSHPKLAKKMSTRKITWNVNGLAQLAGIIALNDGMHLNSARRVIIRERKFMFGEIFRRLKTFSTVRSDVNFYLLNLHGRNSTRLRDYLLKMNRVLVRDCSTFRGIGKNFIRVAIKNRKQNLELLRILELID
jgi:threonine-phosphate decarboxylase